MCLNSILRDLCKVLPVRTQPLPRNEPLLFPNLHTLFISDLWFRQPWDDNWTTQNDAVQNLRLVLSPFTRHLELVFPGHDDRSAVANLVGDCLSIIANKAPNLRVLKINTNAISSESHLNGHLPTPPSFAVLANLEELEYFGFPQNWASCSLLHILASLPKLQLLDIQYDEHVSFDTHSSMEESQVRIRMARTNSGDSETITKAKPYFPALDGLLLHSSLDRCQRLFSSSPSVPQLDFIGKVSVTLEEEEQQQQFDSCQILAARLPGIEILKLNSMPYREWGERSGTIKPACLYAWKENNGFKLTSLDVRGVVFENGDRDTAGLFPSWPNLKRLTFLAPLISQGPVWVDLESMAPSEMKGLTIETLGHAASKLKKLETLELTLVASNTKSLPDPPAKFQECFKTFKLGDPFFNFRVKDFDLQDAARYISSLFDLTVAIPNITLFEDRTIPTVIAYIHTFCDESWTTDRNLSEERFKAKRYHEDYLAFHRELDAAVFGRDLDVAMNQTNLSLIK
jgi:hypothetical protein